MSNACFEAAKDEELMLIKHSLEKEGKWTNAQIAGFLLQGKVRRYIPDPVTLASRVTSVMLDFKNVVDTKNQLPLLTAKVWEQFFRNLKSVQAGLLTG